MLDQGTHASCERGMLVKLPWPHGKLHVTGCFEQATAWGGLWRPCSPWCCASSAPTPATRCRPLTYVVWSIKRRCLATPWCNCNKFLHFLAFLNFLLIRQHAGHSWQAAVLLQQLKWD